MADAPTTPGRGRGAAFGLGFGLGLAVAALIGAALIAPLALLHRGAGDMEQAYSDRMIGLVTQLSSRDVGPNPVVANPRLLLQAREAYTGSCSQCHGAAGNGQGAFGATSFPPAADLTGQAAHDLSDGQLFVAVKNGLGFTGMPAYGTQYTDQEIWGLVQFIRALQGGQTVLLPVPPANATQLTAAGVPQGGDARRGASLFAAYGCAACHQPVGGLSIHPQDREVEESVRRGQPGMPCYAPGLLTDAQLLDIRTYIATFPTSGVLGAPRRPGGGAQAGEGNEGGQGSRGNEGAAAPGAAQAGPAGTPGPARPPERGEQRPAGRCEAPGGTATTPGGAPSPAVAR